MKVIASWRLFATQVYRKTKGFIDLSAKQRKRVLDVYNFSATKVEVYNNLLQMVKCQNETKRDLEEHTLMPVQRISGKR